MFMCAFHLFRVISCEEGKALAESWNAAFMESSAKENQVRVEATETAARALFMFGCYDGLFMFKK